MEPWWVLRWSEIAAAAAIVGMPVAIWLIGRALTYFKQRRRWMLLGIAAIGGHVVLIGLGVTAAIFFMSAHDDHGAPSGIDYVQAAVAVLAPLIVGGPVALIVWTGALIGAWSTPRQ